MSPERRLPTAQRLRSFFDQQIAHLQQLTSMQTPRDEASQRVETLIDATNARVRVVQDYKNQLRTEVIRLYQHVLEISAAIPAPIWLTRQSFSTDPLVNALFVNPDDIHSFLNQDPIVTRYLDKCNPGELAVIYGLLTAQKHEKTVLSNGLVGNQLVRELVQQTINFHSHKIQTACSSHSELENSTRDFLFKLAIEQINQALKQEENQLEYWTKKTYEERLQSLANPEVYLLRLLHFLKDPQQIIDIENQVLRLSKLGVKLNNEAQQAVNEFELYELIFLDQSRMTISQITCPRHSNEPIRD